MKVHIPPSLNNFSPPPSPGPPDLPNSPTTQRAKELAALYPTREAMLERSESFGNAQNMGLNEFYDTFQRLFPNGNGPRYT